MSKTQGRPPPLRIGDEAGAAPAAHDPTRAAIEQLGGARGMTRTDTGYTTAIVVQVPRRLDKIVDAVLYEAAQAGEDFIYTWRQKDKNSKEPDGKTTIEGMSIDGAMIVVRNWGNCALPTELVDETPTHYLLKCTFVDLETGFTLPRLYRQRKSGGPGGGGWDSDRKEDIAFSIGQSKCQRNAIDKGVPAWLINKAIDAAKSNAAAKYKAVEMFVPLVAEYAAKGGGVTLAQLEARIGKPSLAWTPYDILSLKMTFRAIADRETTWHEEFPPPDLATDVVDAKPETTDGGAAPTADAGAPPAAATAETKAEPAETKAPAAETKQAEAETKATAGAPPKPFTPPPGAGGVP